MRDSAAKEGLRWLRQGKADLGWARHRAEEGAYHLCFLAQKVSEKALKGFLYAQGEEMVLGHSVQRLGISAAAFDPEFEVRARSWSVVDGYYVPTRYPSGLPDGIPADVYKQQAAKDAVALAEDVVRFVAERLGDRSTSV